jgi:hypothetical protein
VLQVSGVSRVETRMSLCGCGTAPNLTERQQLLQQEQQQPGSWLVGCHSHPLAEQLA